MRALLTAIFVLIGCASYAVPPSVPSPKAPLDGNGRVGVAYTYAGNNLLKNISNSWGLAEANFNVTGTIQTVRIQEETLGQISEQRLLISNTQLSAGGTEQPGSNPVFYRGCVEYPAGGNSSPPCFALDGQTLFELDPSSNAVPTSFLYLQIPALTTYFIRYEEMVATPPTLTTPTASAGGSLTAGTYYYEFTCVVPTGSIRLAESGPSAQVSAATSGSNLTLTVPITLPTIPIGCPQIKVYRGTTSNGETYLTSILTPAASFVDTGSIAPIASSPPPSAPVLIANMFPRSVDYYAAADLAVGTGTTGFTAGPSSSYMIAPLAVQADDTANSSTLWLGDSLAFGHDITNPQASYGVSQQTGNFTNLAFAAAGAANSTVYNYVNAGVSGRACSSFTASAGIYGSNTTAAMMDAATNIISNLSDNDLANSETWQQDAQCQMQLSKQASLRGQKWYLTTLGLFGAATNQNVTVTGFVPAASETQRENYNSWVRNGMQYTGTNTPVLSGGVPWPYFQPVYWDLAAAEGEVNSSNVPTLNGGYWPAFSDTVAHAESCTTTSFANCYFAPFLSGQVLTSGTQSATSLHYANSYAPGALIGYTVLFTSGAQAGNSCMISNSTTTLLYCNGNGTNLPGAPATGDTFLLFAANTHDGEHPSTFLNIIMATGTNPFSTLNLESFVLANIH